MVVIVAVLNHVLVKTSVFGITTVNHMVAEPQSV